MGTIKWCAASLFIRELLKFHNWVEPPFRAVVCGCRT